MKGDFTRLTFDPDPDKEHYRGVLMQQGRAFLDSDWNEQVQIAEYRYRTFFRDFVGQSGAPANDGMALKEVPVDGGIVRIVLTEGRYYVNGLLVENKQQAALMPADLQEGDGLYLIYLDVWTNHITAAEDNTLLEPALGGADTTTRICTEWKLQAKRVGDLSASIEQFGQRYRPSWPTPKYDWELSLSSGQLTIDPTSVRVSDNRLYRIEIHDSGSPANGDPGTATFKWSSNNGSTIARVKQIEANTTLVLENADKRTIDAFRGAQYVEITDALSFQLGRPGAMRALAPYVENGRLTVTPALTTALGAGVTVRRWDSLPTKITKDRMPLGSDLVVTFEADHVYYRAGDYWLIPVRSGTVLDWVIEQPQKRANGIWHNFAALALVSKQGDQLQVVDDLHTSFEPLTSGAVSKLGDTIDGNLCVRGNVGIGICNYRAPLSITAASNGGLLSFEDQSGNEAWRIGLRKPNASQPLAFVISDLNNRGLSVADNGVGMSGNLDVANTVTAAAFRGAGAVLWQEISESGVLAAPNAGYVVTNTELVTITLPLNPNVGDIVRVAGSGGGGWKVSPNVNQAVITTPIGVGISWTGHDETIGDWQAVASSANGQYLFAAAYGKKIYTSRDYGQSWFDCAGADPEDWRGVACSEEGQYVVAVPSGDSGDQIYTSDDFGDKWTRHGPMLKWRGVACSANGQKLVAVAENDQIYTSDNFGQDNFAQKHQTSQEWRGVACSADGQSLIAVGLTGIYVSQDRGANWPWVYTQDSAFQGAASSRDGNNLIVICLGGQVYTSKDSGHCWSPHGESAFYRGVASSADGKNLVAVGNLIYTSTDYGQSWRPRENSRQWEGVASSADGTNLVAVEYGGKIYTSKPRTTPGGGGCLIGDTHAAIELQYIGNGQWRVLSFVGTIEAF